MTLPTDYIDGDVLTAADVNAITTAVNSNTDLKVAVGTFNAKGDLLVGLTNDSVGVLTAGTNGYLLSASSGATAGVAWVPSGGKVLQIASDYVSGSQTTTSTSATDIPGLSITFVPVSASSTIVLELTTSASVYASSGPPNEKVGFVQTSEGGLVAIGEYYNSAVDTTKPVVSPVISRVVIANASTASRTYTGQFFTIADNTIELQYGMTLTATEYL